MSIREHAPFDEDTLRALFDEIEPPPGLADRWRAGNGKPRTHSPPPGVRMRAAAVVVGVLTVGAVVFGVVAADRYPPAGPEITITDPPATSSAPPPTTASPSDSTVVPRERPGPGAQADAGPAPTKRPPPKPGKPTVAPARGLLPPDEWPSAANAGVPPETDLSAHPGDLHVDQPGAVISDRRIVGSVFIEAPDVTLRRVQVAPPGGAVAVRQLPGAPRLRIEDSDISGAGGSHGVLQEAPGLTISRSDLHDAETLIEVTTDVMVVDSYLHDSTSQVVYAQAGAARLTLRHNTMSEALTLDDAAGPVVDVAIESNQLVFVAAPPGAGSRDIRVRNNRFTRSPTGEPQPVSNGWNSQAPGNIWSRNVWADTGEPVDP